MSKSSKAIPVFLVLALLALISACGSDSGSKAATTTTQASTHSGHGSGSSEEDHKYGGVHAPPAVSVDEIAKLGNGPQVGDRWTASIGVNVCGRFLDPLPGVVTNGIAPQPDGKVQIAPTNATRSGLSLTLADYAKAVGIGLKTGELTLPAGMTPSEIPVGEETVPLAGRTFVDGADCGGTKANVVVWVYPPDAVETGKGLVTVAEDPQNIPFPKDGMAMVITLTPESSLPTLPPSAVVAG